MIEINLDNINTKNETTNLRFGGVIVSIGDIFTVEDKVYTTMHANTHNDMFYMVNLTDNIIEDNMAFDTIYDMLDANFRHCKIKFITYRFKNK